MTRVAINHTEFIIFIGLILVIANSEAAGIVTTENLGVELQLSSNKILVGDYCAYRLRFTNRSSSTVYISARHSSLVIKIEHRFEKEKWRVLRINSPETLGLSPYDLHVPAKTTFSELGTLFCDGDSNLAFDKAGEHRIRMSLECPLGKYTTNEVVVVVTDRPNAQLKAIEKERRQMPVIFDPLITSESHHASVDQVAEMLTGGSIHDAFRRRQELENYSATGRINGEEVSYLAALEKLQAGLDEVRQERLVITLAHEARRKKRWKDMDNLLKKLKDDSASKRDLEHALEVEIRRGRYVRE